MSLQNVGWTWMRKARPSSFQEITSLFSFWSNANNLWGNGVFAIFIVYGKVKGRGEGVDRKAGLRTRRVRIVKKEHVFNGRDGSNRASQWRLTHNDVPRWNPLTALWSTLMIYAPVVNIKARKPASCAEFNVLKMVKSDKRDCSVAFEKRTSYNYWIIYKNFWSNFET